MNDRRLTEYVGNLHVHTSHSDGAGGVPEIARAAKRVGLDFVGINDHDFMTDGLHLEEQGLYDGVMVLMGLEIGERYHHYLAYGIKEMIRSDQKSPQEVIDCVNEQGGFGFLAHPFEKGMPFSERSVAYTWNDLAVRRYAGVCIWNFTSRWKERIKSPFHGLYCLLFKAQSLKGPSLETLYFWDEKCRMRKVVAIGGSDAHGAFFERGFLRLRPLSYETLLGSINVHLLLERRPPRDFETAKAMIFEGLKEGRLFISHDGLFPGKGFRFYYVSEKGGRLRMGEEASFRPGRLVTEIPAQGEIRLVRDGRPVEKWVGLRAEYPVEKEGVYRVEVYRRLAIFGWRPWIFSNPIYLR